MYMFVCIVTICTSTNELMYVFSAKTSTLRCWERANRKARRRRKTSQANSSNAQSLFFLLRLKPSLDPPTISVSLFCTCLTLLTALAALYLPWVVAEGQYPTQRQTPRDTFTTNLTSSTMTHTKLFGRSKLWLRAVSQASVCFHGIETGEFEG